MKYLVVGFGALVAVVAVAWVPLAGQAPRTAESPATATTLPRTAWGAPNLQGFWSPAEVELPLERPKEFAGREFLTDAEVAAKQAEVNARAASKLAGTSVEHGFRAQENYNAIFSYQPAGTVSRRTGAIIDPPDGRLPRWTPQQVKRYEALEAVTRGRGEGDSYEDRSLNERCIPVVSPARVPSWGLGARVTDEVLAAHSDVDVDMVNGRSTVIADVGRILQTPGYVAMVMSFAGQADEARYRIIPVDGRPALGPKIRQYMGDARGRWEGNTLVVETTNINDQQTNAGRFLPTYEQYLYPGSGETLRVIERFTLIDANTIEYRYTIEDPEVYTRPYTALLTFRRNDKHVPNPPLCHEGNKDIAMIMANSRSDEPNAVEYSAESARNRQQRLNELKAEWAQLKKGESR
jgi:hypothetical protein